MEIKDLINFNQIQQEEIKLLREKYKQAKSISQATIEELSRRLKNQEIKAKSKIDELVRVLEKTRQNFNVYVPKKSDNIDEKLAHFLNKYPDKENFKIMFIRESDGYYRFGKKRVEVKLD